MLTKNEVVNLALGKLGQSVSVINIDTETTTYARIAKRHFSMALTAILKKHPWSVYGKTAALSLIEENPTPQWMYAYDLPADSEVIRRLATDRYFMHELEYEDQIIPFDIAYDPTGYELHTNLRLAWAEYTLRPPEAGPFPDHFGRALAAMLAMDMAPSIITNNYIKMKDLFLKEARNEISEQIALDITMRPDATAALSPFIRARFKQ